MNQPCKIDLDKLSRLAANVKSHSDDYSTRSSRCEAKKIVLVRKNARCNVRGNTHGESKAREIVHVNGGVSALRTKISEK